MNILITGGTGHVGVVLAQRLIEEGHTVRTLALDNSPAIERLRALGVQHYHVDIRDAAALTKHFNNIELVFHLAAVISFRDNDWSSVKPVNVDGVQNIVNACKAAGVRRMVHFSSIDAFAANPGGPAIDESCPLVSDNYFLAYPRSKAMGQRVVMNAMREGLDAVIIYPTSITGPYDHMVRASNIPMLMIARGEMKVVLTGGLNWVDVRDLVSAAITAAQSAPAGASYLVGGTYASMRDLAVLLQPITGLPVPRIEIPLGLVGVIAPFAAKWTEMRGGNSPVTISAVRGLSGYPRVSHARAARELGYAPRPLQQTIADTYRWFADMGFLDPARKVY